MRYNKDIDILNTLQIRLFHQSFIVVIRTFIVTFNSIKMSNIITRLWNISRFQIRQLYLKYFSLVIRNKRGC